MTTFQKIAVTAALTLTVGAGIFEAKQAHDVQGELTGFQAQQAPTQEQIRQLQNDLSNASNTIAGLREDFTKNQKDNTELLKLRGQAAVLQSEKEKLVDELKEAEDDAARMDDVISNTPPVRTFVKTISCRVKSGDGVVFGGWQTAAGKRTFVVVTPQLGTDNGTITAKSQVVEMSEGAAAQSGFSNLYSTNVYSNSNIVQRPQKVFLTFSANDLQGIMQQVSTSDGFKNVAEPQIQVADGRLADVLMGEARQTASGEPYSIGPEINVVPSVMPDGTTISLFLTAQVNVPIDF